MNKKLEKDLKKIKLAASHQVIITYKEVSGKESDKEEDTNEDNKH